MSELKFEIDFFEFSFLVEACIPPVPIARGMFWDRVIDVEFYRLSPNQRARLLEWIMRHPNFDMENIHCKWFYHRFNPDNQYLVEVEHDGTVASHQAFKWIDGEYHISTSTRLAWLKIKNVTKLNP